MPNYYSERKSILQVLFAKFLKNIPFFQKRNPILLLGTRQSQGLISTRTISGPIRRIQFHGITKSSCLPNSPRKRQGPGTMIATTHPSGSSTLTSEMKPSRWPSLTQMTSLHRSSVKRILMLIPPAMVFLKGMRWRGMVCQEIFFDGTQPDWAICYCAKKWGSCRNLP